MAIIERVHDSFIYLFIYLIFFLKSHIEKAKEKDHTTFKPPLYILSHILSLDFVKMFITDWQTFGICTKDYKRG